MRAWIFTAVLAACSSPRPAADAGPPPPCVGVLREGSWVSVAVADFDRDGRPDIAAARAGEVLLLHADGGTLRSLAVPRPMAVAAIDGEVVAVEPARIWLSNGTRQVDVSPGVVGVAAADFDGDGRTDLAVVNQAISSAGVLLRLADGGFSEAAWYRAGLSASAIAAADLDGDGRIDLAVAGFDAPDVSVLRALGDGGFADAVSFAAGWYPLALAAGDFDRDGRADVAAACSGVPEVTLVRAGASVETVTVTAPVRGIASGDFDGDGDEDLAVSRYAQPGVVAVLESVDGGFGSAAERAHAAGVRPAALAAGDLDGDGRAEVIAADDADGGLIVLSGSCF